MAIKKINSNDISALYFVRHSFRTDMNFFVIGLDELRKEMNKWTASYPPTIFEVQFWANKPEFAKLSKAQLKNLDIKID
jgi:hypothetical protein